MVDTVIDGVMVTVILAVTETVGVGVGVFKTNDVITGSQSSFVKKK